MNTDKELKPCPFCGEEAEISIDGDCDISWSVGRVVIECCECEAEMYFVNDKALYNEKLSKEMRHVAVKAWNSRASQSEWVSVRLDNSKSWLDQNVHDGEDRVGAKNDVVTFSPDDLQELFDDFVEYVKGPSE